MKVLILAGGFGTRIGEEVETKPKPMLEIGGKPMLWHIMNIYAHHGFNEFVVLLGYKGFYIKEYFANFFLHRSDVTIDLAKNSVKIHKTQTEDWKVSLIDTGYNTLTAGRIKRAAEYINGERFMLTYGDAVSNINIKNLVKFHEEHKKLITMTTVQPDGRFGAVDINQDYEVTNFIEKPRGDGFWVNGGFFVCEPEVLNYIPETGNEEMSFEGGPLLQLAKEHQLCAYNHHEFWKCMDTARDKNELNRLWDTGQCEWKVWQN